MPADPQAGALLAGGPTVAAVRAATRAYADLHGEVVPVARVRDLHLPGPASAPAARLHYPAGEPPFPCLVHFHGGGWVSGDLDTYDAPSRRLANATGCVVVTVDYRKAPEHKFPAPLDDCHAAVSWIAAHAAELDIDAGRIGVSGDSAGGNLAAATCLRARDTGGPAIRFQVLIYPATDAACATSSYDRYAEGYGLERRTMRWNWEQYLAHPDDGDHPYASPLRAELGGLPPALVVSAEHDPLRDDGELYAQRLAAAGTPVKLTRYAGKTHAFYLREAAPGHNAELYEEIGRETRAYLARRNRGLPAPGSAVIDETE
ncbi:Carboxylesterase NlhH [Nonomuraea coxensis DSM 45129]|uniref:Carboxylesterase NlhH n=1 Tax=Nonomuraea coxensis DSM 45129 TaxID=1122611 RepID=A0ABX8U2W4_9ACTN|nr:alpha/beta hydrolase [Nonomuraea coxensis]QYC42081.1 Carboxylesterase NlhH [Nonomuraea coxensis DSM 45129]